MEFTGENNCVNYFDKTPEEIRQKNQDLHEVLEKIIDIILDNLNNGLNLDNSCFKNLLNIIILIIICYCCCNRIKVAITATSMIKF
jgi:ABC-type proline/glycine betaine transport system permease subunit